MRNERRSWGTIRGEWRLVAPNDTPVDVHLPVTEFTDRAARGDTLDMLGGIGGPGSARARRVRRPDPEGRVTALRMACAPPAPTAPVVCGDLQLPAEDVHSGVISFPVVPLLTSGVTALVAALLFSPIFAVLAGVSALGLFGRWAGSVIGHRRRRRLNEAQVEWVRGVWRARSDAWLLAEASRCRSAATCPERLLDVVGGDRSPWSVRLEAGNALRLVLGRGDVEVDVGRDIDALPSMVGDTGTGTLRDVPVSVDVVDGLAVCGDRADVLASARWLVASSATEIGPADLGLVVVTTADRCVDWDWVKWLPSLDACVVVCVDGDASLLDLATAERPVMVVVDGAEPLAPGPMARVMAGRVSAVRLLWLGTPDDVPGGCRDRLDVSSDGRGVLRCAGRAPSRLEWYGLALADADTVARWVAPFIDPEVDDAAERLPNSVSFDGLCDVEAQMASWHRSTPDALVAPIGVDADGVHVVDLVADGPHCLAAGTTGAGKSELLRTMVVGLAAAQGPDVVSFVLIDFKGGGAFDVVADLPHVAAVVTDLDAAEASRALRGLRAELLDRERRLRDMECSDIADIDRRHPRAFARLVVMVDEFAALADELPDFLDGLIDIARRGRSLGVHLVLATQRPSGVVTGEIRANTNLRICLRVQDRSDSLDVVDGPEAAWLPQAPGRAIVRRGGGPCEVVQVAHIGSSASIGSVEPFMVHPVVQLSGPERSAMALVESWWRCRVERENGQAPGERSRNVVARLVEGCEAAGLERTPAPWRPRLEVAGFPMSADASPARPAVGIGLLDDPDRRRVVPVAWDPRGDGLLIVGVDDDEIASTAAVAVAALIDPISVDPARLEPGPQRWEPLPTYVLDGRRTGAAAIGALSDLGPVIDVVGVDEPERLARAVDLLGGEARSFALVIHDWGSVADALSDHGGPGAPEQLTRLVRRGVAGTGAVIVTARSDRDVPQRVASHLGCRVVHRLGDPAGYLSFGVRSADVSPLAGAGCLEPASGLAGVVGRLDRAALAALGERLDEVRVNGSVPWAQPIRVLGAGVDRAELPVVKGSADGWLVPIGLDADLAPFWVDVAVGRPVVILAHPGGGRSTTVRTMTEPIDGDLCVIDDADRLGDDELGVRISTALAAARPIVVACTMAAARRFTSPLAGLLALGTVVMVNPARGDADVARVAVPDLADHPRGRAAVVDRGRVTVVQVAH